VFVKSWPKSIVNAVDQATLERVKAIMAHNEEMKAYGTILAPALLLFFCGITKCVFKPWDLKRVSVNSLVDSSSGSEEKGGESEMNSLQEYVGAATQYFEAGHGRARLQQEPSGSDEAEADADDTCEVHEVWKPYNLCVDLAPLYSGRLSCLKHMVRNPADEAHRLVKSNLSATFHQLYTKESLKLHDISHLVFTNNAALNRWTVLTSARGLRMIAATALLGAIAVFRYAGGVTDQVPTDVTITYALLWSALVMEYVLPTVIHHTSGRIERLVTGHRTWPDQVAQYNLMGYVARSRQHSWLMKAAACLGCRDLVDQLWTMKPCKGASSKEITGLVHGHVAGGWTEGHIAGADSFRAFNDYRGQWILNKQVGVGRTSVPSRVLMSVSRPFDESVLVWHLATDFCFHLLQEDPSPSSATARHCREVSNYMAYLLFVKPEMLMLGARRARGPARAGSSSRAAGAGQERPRAQGRPAAQEGRRRHPGLSRRRRRSPGLVRSRGSHGFAQGQGGGDVDRDTGRVGGDALLLGQQVQRLPARQELGHRRGVPVLRLAPPLVHGDGDLGGEDAEDGAV
jgi:hypothetical protein